MTVNGVELSQAHEQVERWNSAHPVGTEVVVQGYAGAKLTRTPAMLLFDRKPVIYLEGHNGYFDLSAVVPAGPVRPAVRVQPNLCYMLPGQGSQSKGMGESLFEEFPDLVSVADRVLGYSIRELCLQDPGDRLVQTQYTQPALYTVNVLTYLQTVRNSGIKPEFVLGHSLGEYSALFAAEVFDFETGLRLVQKRGALMAEATGGGMAAVIGLDVDQVRQVLRERALDMIDLANINAPTQMVISGPRHDVLRAQADFEAAGAKRYVPLAVSGAFHSRYMRDAQAEFRAFLDGFELRPPALTVISNVEAMPYEASRTRSLLAEQLTAPVRWVESIHYLKRRGVETFREIGPGTVLSALFVKIPAPV